MMWMEGTGLVLRGPTHAMMGTLLEILVGEEELARNQGIGMGGLNIAIVIFFYFTRVLTIVYPTVN